MLWPVGLWNLERAQSSVGPAAFERARVGTVVYTGTLHERMIHPARCGTERPHLRYLSVAPAPREPSEYFGYLCSRPGAAEPDGEPAGRRGLSARGAGP